MPETLQNGRGRVLREHDWGSAIADRPQTRGRGIAPPPLDAARQLVVVARAWGMGGFNGGQRSGLRHRGACVETRAGNATERRGGSHDRRPDARYR